MLASRRAARELGVMAEERVATLLQKSGWSVLDRNWRGGRGELDIVVRRGTSLRFVEVKARSTLEDGLDSLTSLKQKKLISAAESWLVQNEGEYTETAFLLAIVLGGTSNGPIEWIDNPFDE